SSLIGRLVPAIEAFLGLFSSLLRGHRAGYDICRHPPHFEIQVRIATTDNCSTRTDRRFAILAPGNKFLSQFILHRNGGGVQTEEAWCRVCVKIGKLW